MSPKIQLESDQAAVQGRNKRHHFLSGPFPFPEGAPDLQPSTTLLERFVIKKSITNGRGTSIYLAEDLLQSAEVALKIVDAGPLSNDSNTLHLRQEINVNRMIRNFDHIIKIFDIYSASFAGISLLFLSMEYADGGNLREWLFEHQENPELRCGMGLRYFIQACRGISHLHDTAGMIHLDIKPENMLFSNNVLKIADLGSALAPGILKSRKNSRRAVCIQECFTPQYTSPELFSGNRKLVSPRSDIYSLGVILYELLHPKGHILFKGSAERPQEPNLKAAPPPLRNVSQALNDVVNRCLALKGADHYESVNELVADLENATNNGMAEPSKKPDQNCKKATKLLSQGNLVKAAALIEKLLVADSSNRAALKLRAIINERYAQAESIYLLIEEGIESYDLETLVEHLVEAAAIYPNHPDGFLARKRVEAKVKRFRAAMEKGAEALKKGLWEQALHWLSTAHQLDPGSGHLRELLNALSNITRIREDINQALVQNDFNKARSLASLLDVKILEMGSSVPLLSRRYTWPE
jgi:serine/threonine protein kinase